MFDFWSQAGFRNQGHPPSEIFSSSLMRKFLSYGRWSRLAFTSSCHPNHVNYVIMPTSHHQVAGKCNSSEACELTGKNPFGRKPCFFSGNVVPGVPKVGSLFLPLRASVSTKKWTRLTKSAPAVARVRFQTISLNAGMLGALWKIRPAKCASKMCMSTL